jgi:hypothetical protein
VPGFFGYGYPGALGYGYYPYYGYGGLAGMGLYGLYGGYDGFGTFNSFDYPGAFFAPGYPSYGLRYGVYDPYAPSSSSLTSSPGSDSTEVFVPDARASSGGLRLRIKPDNASVYVDGHYAGLVNQYDGIFHKMRLGGGNHGIEIRAPGYQTLKFNVRIERDRTETYRGELEKDLP